ncbi:hypothetical protein [Methylobacterium bullatum]|uniref:hypothetical protein n=1 Tax=Methylobacterium bullatum TaxID=570505 RepID=UPI0030CEBC30
MDYAILVKLYGPAPGGTTGCYSAAEGAAIRKTIVTGSPDEAHVSTSYVERQNLTTRMQMKRFNRLSNAFSKKFENYAPRVAFYTVWYKFVKIRMKHRMSPAMAAVESDQL